MNLEEKRSNPLFAFILVFTLIALALLLHYTYDEPSPGEEQDNKQVKIVCMPKSRDDSNDFWSAMMEGAEIAATERDVKLTIMAPSLETEIDKQNAMIEEAIAMKPNAIALAPCDFYQTTPYAQKIIDAGIKLVILDSTMDTDFGSTVVATDNTEAGRKMGNYMLPYLNKDSVIGIVGHVKGTSTAVEREQGIRESIGEYEKQIVDVVFCNSNYGTAYDVTAKLIQEHPDMNILFGLNEYSAVGAGRAIQDLGLKGKIRMVGFDASLEEVNMMEAGIIDAIVVQKALNMGYLGVSIAYQESLSSEVAENVDSGSVLITKDTIYEEENQKLLFPFKKK